VDISGGHSVFDDALHTSQADAETILDEFADGADAAVGQMIDIIFRFLSDVQADDFADNIYQIFPAQNASFFVHRQTFAKSAV